MVVVDNEKSLNSDSILYMLEDQLNIKVFKTPPYKSTVNGQVERFHSTLSEIMRCLKTEKTHRTFEELLDRAVYEYDCTIHSTTGKKPIELFFGRRVRTIPEQYENARKENIEAIVKKQAKDIENHNKKRNPFKDYIPAKFENCLEKWKETSTPFFKRDEIQLSSDSSQKSSFVSVKEILSNTFNGKEILKFYSKNDILREEQRNLLISTVAKYIEGNGIPYTISDCADIENQICNIFPSEQLDFYSNGKRGKIYNKLSNLKRLSKDIFKEKSSPEEDKTFEPEENVAVTLQYLRLPTITADEFDLYWCKCARYRLKQISESKSTAEIFQMWPEYKKPSGSNLINIDFELKFPFAKQFSERWLCYKDKVIYLLQSKISNLTISKKMQQIHTFNEESVVLTVLWNIHHLFPPTQKVTSDMSGAKIRKKFSVLDSQESFAILAESEEEIEIKLKLLMLQGPKLLISGNLEDIKSIFVYFDGNKYPFLTIVKAFDLLFKIFFVFNLQFPEESEIFYNFIQDFFL
ncbi:uncharacterized protein LOC119612917 [Lucilia sericata]|uniref:uncharacterized protein LOC119612917 n=1 Tax=Lucilia sericata TaxID=13632 RepID=UPI0018A83DFC|nr:uncharacterized protein LOC119612917 [Lucilia sericata]